MNLSLCNKLFILSIVIFIFILITVTFLIVKCIKSSRHRYDIEKNNNNNLNEMDNILENNNRKEPHVTKTGFKTNITTSHLTGKKWKKLGFNNN